MYISKLSLSNLFLILPKDMSSWNMDIALEVVVLLISEKYQNSYTKIMKLRKNLEHITF